MNNSEEKEIQIENNPNLIEIDAIEITLDQLAEIIFKSYMNAHPSEGKVINLNEPEINLNKAA